MNDGEEMFPKSYRLLHRQMAIVQAHADANFDGNLSMALRRIIDEWAQFKGTQMPLPLPTIESK